MSETGVSPRRRLLITVDAVGGVWSYGIELCSALVPLGYEIVLACLGPSPDRARRERAAAIAGLRLIETGLPLDWLAADDDAAEAAGAAIAALAAAQGVDLVHLNQPALAGEVAFPVPVVAAIHSCVATWWDAVQGGEPPVEFGWRTRRMARALRRADVVVAPSRAFADAVRQRYDLPAMPAVVWNGRTPLASAEGRETNDILTAGRLWDRGKNIAMLDRAASRMRHPLRAAGATVGPHGEAIALEHIQPLGSLDEHALGACFSGRPIFVSPALYEPFGLAVLEAAQAGCPLVLADISSFRELWDGAALLVPPRDEVGFAKTLDALVGDPGARATLGEAARKRAARYTPARTAEAMTAIYDRLLAQPASRDAAA